MSWGRRLYHVPLQPLCCNNNSIDNSYNNNDDDDSDDDQGASMGLRLGALGSMSLEGTQLLCTILYIILYYYIIYSSYIFSRLWEIQIKYLRWNYFAINARWHVQQYNQCQVTPCCNDICNHLPPQSSRRQFSMSSVGPLHAVDDVQLRVRRLTLESQSMEHGDQLDHGANTPVSTVYTQYTNTWFHISQAYGKGHQHSPTNSGFQKF